MNKGEVPEVDKRGFKRRAGKIPTLVKGNPVPVTIPQPKYPFASAITSSRQPLLKGEFNPADFNKPV